MSSASDTPGVSAIIPAFNYARYLPLAVESVLAQDYPAFELIVVDDGSTDNTRAVLQPYEGRIRYRYQANAGLSAARNAGIRDARFPYVAFLDADDLWRPGLLKTLMARFLASPADTGLVACHSQRIDSEGRPMPNKPFIRLQGEVQELFAEDLLLKTRFGSSGLVVARAAFDECGLFDTSLRSSEDRDMWIRIAARRRIFLLTSPLALVRRHPTNMSKDPDRMKSFTGRVLQQAYRRGVVPRRRWFFWMRAFAYWHHEAAWTYYDVRRYGKALGELALSLGWCPFFRQAWRVDEPALFRLRALARFLRDSLTRPKALPA
ncbi:MAG: glycosyltransferase family 2 protein [Lentisphaerae bacterium]|nr:glycosyltransferase family 2 protein [Lentisphaerota bacterium]